MATYSITHQQRIDDYLVVQTLEGTDIGTGQAVTLSGLSPAGLNTTYTVDEVPTHLYLGTDEMGDWLFDWDVFLPNQLLMYSSGVDIARAAVVPPGTLTHTLTCTWVTAASVIAWLGIAAATANDTAFITTATNAANAFAYRRRRESGYFDSLTTSPGADVTLGTTMYAAVLYRERGSVDSFASFDQMGGAVPFGSNGQINKLLGVNRAQVA
jgi:hypothetical protein